MVRKKAQLTSSKPRAQAKPLRTSGDYVRASVPATGVPLIEVMGRAMTAYAQFPIRLLKCTSPAQLWSEYLRFGQVLFSCFASLPHSEFSGGEERQRSAGRRHRSSRSSRVRH
jgi:hypothetical protein